MNETHISPIANDLFGIETVIGLKPYEMGTLNNDLEAMADFLKQLSESGYHIGEIAHDTLNGFSIKFHEIFTLDELFESLPLGEHDFLKDPVVPSRLGIRDDQWQYDIFKIGESWCRHKECLEKKGYGTWNFAFTKAFASTIAPDLISVQPMSGPTGKIFYLDFKTTP